MIFLFHLALYQMYRLNSRSMASVHKLNNSMQGSCKIRARFLSGMSRIRMRFVFHMRKKMLPSRAQEHQDHAREMQWSAQAFCQMVALDSI